MSAIIVACPAIINGNDFGAFILTWILLTCAVIILLTVFCLVVYRLTLSALLMVVTFITCFALFYYLAYPVHDNIRWLALGSKYQRKVLAQATPPDALFKHAEWDGWGMAGNDTTVYLVYDPQDTLRLASTSAAPGKYTGLPCKVYHVKLRQSHWYTVMFYTNTAWEDCGDAGV